jgi:hypothetical protein
MSEEKKSFNVKDRRMFTADGEVRRGDDDDLRDVARPAAGPASPEPGTGPAPTEPPPAEGAPRGADASGPEPPVDFAGFLVSLATQAMQALAQQPPRLREARTLINIVEMLQDKSEGRRTPEENEVLEALLYQLRMGYLERQRAGGA